MKKIRYKCICRAIFRLAVSVCCHRKLQWTLNAKIRNMPYCVRVASTTSQEPIRLWEKALACTLVYIVKSGATARNTDSKFASFSWTFGNRSSRLSLIGSVKISWFVWERLWLLFELVLRFLVSSTLIGWIIWHKQANDKRREVYV